MSRDRCLGREIACPQPCRFAASVRSRIFFPQMVHDTAEDRSAVNAPHTYPRRILVAVTGLSPQIVTETVYALAHREPAFVPTEIQLLTTAEGARSARLSLIEGDGWLKRLCMDYGLADIAFSPSSIHMLANGDGVTLADIRTPRDNEDAADLIVERIRALSADPDAALHVSIAGGRKTMGFFAGYALSLYGRRQDRLSHVLVSPPFESHREFYYPPPYSRVIHVNDRPYDARDARVTLAKIPFVRLREGLPEEILDGRTRFSEAVAGVQRALAPAELVIDLAGKRLRAGGRVVRLSPVQLAFIAWFARHRSRGEPWLACPAEGAPEPGYADAFLSEYRAVIGEMGDDERTATRLHGGMSAAFFSQTKSKLHTSLWKQLGHIRARPYFISGDGPRPMRRYGLEIAAGAIRFEQIECAGG